MFYLSSSPAWRVQSLKSFRYLCYWSGRADHGTRPFSSLSRDRADVFRSSQDFQHDSSCNWEKNILQLLWTLIVFGTPCVCVMMACHAHEATADRLCWSKAAPDRPMTRHNNDRSGLFSLMSSTDFPVQHPTSLWTQMNWIICSPSLSIL